ncbi:hypothetical protein AAFF_G00146210 [Aldrovandia affinis]|uniref:Uncharacterized protein n=1 Tax=Aldrovandia affinis TaxID=143900 RepID=A0AAD7RQ23_9TELE|nr:hypothetical protein AAFF_G00146210 [Aldrovandia affinis]
MFPGTPNHTLQHNTSKLGDAITFFRRSRCTRRGPGVAEGCPETRQQVANAFSRSRKTQLCWEIEKVSAPPLSLEQLVPMGITFIPRTPYSHIHPKQLIPHSGGPSCPPTTKSITTYQIKVISSPLAPFTTYSSSPDQGHRLLQWLVPQPSPVELLTEQGDL